MKRELFGELPSHLPERTGRPGRNIQTSGLFKAQSPWKPTQLQVLAAEGIPVPIPSPTSSRSFSVASIPVYSAAVGHHFARPGNRFWPTLFAAGFTPSLTSPFDERKLLDWGYGITNFVSRATVAADQLSREELRSRSEGVTRKVHQYQPRILALLGITAYRVGFQSPRAALGEQPEPIGRTRVWVLPNPSGLNAHYQGEKLIGMFRALRVGVGPSETEYP